MRYEATVVTSEGKVQRFQSDSGSSILGVFVHLQAHCENLGVKHIKSLVIQPQRSKQAQTRKASHSHEEIIDSVAAILSEDYRRPRSTRELYELVGLRGFTFWGVKPVANFRSRLVKESLKPQGRINYDDTTKRWSLAS